MGSKKKPESGSKKPARTSARKPPGFGYIDLGGTFAIDPVFELVRPFAEGLAFVRKNQQWCVIDRQGRPVFDRRFDDATKFSESMGAVCVGKKWGYLSSDGDLVIAPRFSEAGLFSEGLARVRVAGQKGKVGFIDKQGNFAVEPTFDDAKQFSEGLAPFKRGGGPWFFVGRNGQRSFAGEWTDAEPFAEGRAWVGSEYIDASGVTVRPKTGHPRSSFSLDRACVQVGKLSRDLANAQEAFGYIDHKGDLVIAPEFAFAGTFREGLALVNRGARQRLGELEGGRYSFIDPSGNVACELPQKMETIHYSGLACGRAKFSDGVNIGFVDRAGAAVIAPRFKWALGFTEDLCGARD